MTWKSRALKAEENRADLFDKAWRLMNTQKDYELATIRKQDFPEEFKEASIQCGLARYDLNLALYRIHYGGWPEVEQGPGKWGG